MRKLLLFLCLVLCACDYDYGPEGVFSNALDEYETYSRISSVVQLKQDDEIVFSGEFLYEDGQSTLDGQAVDDYLSRFARMDPLCDRFGEFSIDEDSLAFTIIDVEKLKDIDADVSAATGVMTLDGEHATGMTYFITGSHEYELSVQIKDAS